MPLESHALLFLPAKHFDMRKRNFLTKSECSLKRSNLTVHGTTDALAVNNYPELETAVDQWFCYD